VHDGAVQSVRRNVAILAACQALLFANNTTVIAVNALIGARLAVDAGLPVSFATVPSMFWVIGGAAAAIPAANLMKRVGRRNGFSVGPLLGLGGAAAVSAAIVWKSFVLLCVGTFIFGGYTGFAQQYRFAAADASPPERKPKAISHVLAGGLAGGLFGPELSKHTKDLFGGEREFLGSMAALVPLLVLVLVLLRGLDIPPETEASDTTPARSTRELARQPKFFIAVLATALSYAVMNLLMVSTPLAMTTLCGHPYSAAASVIGFHVIGMFAPSLFTGALITKLGVLRVMFAGVALNLATVAIALSGVTVAHFWWALFVLGVGWNFLYVGGSTLLTETYRPSERASAQGISEFWVFAVMVLSSVGSGFLLDARGWAALNVVAAALIVVVACALAWLVTYQRRSISDEG